MDRLGRVLAGCCWEVLISRQDPDDSVGTLRQAARSLTLTLASYLSEFVAETLRASRTSQGAPLTDEENIHLLAANYWVQPIYQELLRAASGHNASVEGEKKRPCSGLVKIMAKQRRAKTRAPAVDTACVSDWIGGFCPADSLMIWFPAHWAPQLIQELERREQDHRQGSLQWYDEPIPDKYRKQCQDARDSRTLHFQKRQYLKSPIQLLTASIRVDWFSVPVQSFVDRMPNLRQGLIRGVFQTKASSPWAGNKSERIQVSLCLPNERDLDTWYEAVSTLPIAWPDITDIDIDPHYFKKTSAHILLAIRTQMGVSHMWGEILPQWQLLRHHLWNLGPGYHAGRLEELLILNQPCRPGEDVQDSVLPRSYWQQWWNWETTKQEVQNLATNIGVMWFVDENEAVNRILEIVWRDENAMAITYQVAKEHETLKEGRATKRRRKDGLYDKTKAQA